MISSGDPLSVEEKEYNGGEVKALRIHNVQEITLPKLKRVYEEYRVPENATINPECDCFCGQDFADRHIEISWFANG